MILTDTGFWVALINKKDKHHSHAVSYMQTGKERFITTWPILTETCHLLGRDLGINSQTTFLNIIKSDLVSVVDISNTDINVIKQLMIKYADLPMDLADASLVILADQLGHGRILSTDKRDFNTYRRWKNHEPFENLLLPDIL